MRDSSPATEVVHTACKICLSSCGVNVTVDRQANRVLRIEPDRENPYTWRDFCSRGRTAADQVEHPGRIRMPMKRVGDRYVETTYDEAITDIAERLNRIIDRHGPDAVASYMGNPVGFSLSNVMLYPAFLDAIGTQNRYWFGSIDNNNNHVVAEAVFGTPLVVLGTDIDECDCFMLVGTNPAVSGMVWLHSSPDGWRRIVERTRAGADLIVVDPRRTKTAQAAKTHVPVRPGQDWALLLGMIKVILDNGWDRPSSVLPVVGIEELRNLAAAVDLDDLAARCDVPTDVIADVAKRFATARTSMCFSATGVSQTINGTVGEWLSLVLNLVCDRVDTPGGRRFERGFVDMIRLFDMVAPESEHVSRVARRPTVVGFHTLGELPEEITTPGPAQVRAMFINAGNPVVSGPSGNELDAAMAQLDLLVVFDLMQRESHRHAHWLLPGEHWLERSEVHVAFGGLQEQPYAHYAPQAVAPPPGMRPEWEVMVDLCLAMGRNLFGRPGVNLVVRASRALARWTRRPRLAFGPHWLEALMVLSGRRLRLRDLKARPHGWIYADKEYGSLVHSLRTPDRTVHAAVPEYVKEVWRLLAEQPPTPPADHPFVLTNRRHRDAMNSWLNDLPGLFARRRHNDLEVHPDDAARLGLSDGDVACVSSPTGAIELPVTVTTDVRPGTVATHHGWGSRVFDPHGQSEPIGHGANRNVLTPGDHIDRFSQTSGFNDTYVNVKRVDA